MATAKKKAARKPARKTARKASAKSPLRVAVVGLGPIGLEIVRAILGRAGLKLTAAVDLSEELVGKPLHTLVDGAPKKVVISGELSAALDGGVDAIALATSSRFVGIAKDLETAIQKGVHVVSTCEELAAPCVDPGRWARLHARAKAADVTLLGTGVNPGFVMDRLVLQLAGACVSVGKVDVERIVDAAKRRGPLRKKVGEGLTPAEFRAGVKAGRIGHVGLRESATLIARGLGWKLGKYEETIEPEVGSDGKCLGIQQHARGYVDGELLITLHLAMFVGAAAPHDRITLESDPPINLTIAGGTQGDRGTIGTVVNGLSQLADAPRGLVTVADVFS
jgi:2,4-diaminopentanoate dehydrogenase